MKAKPVKAECPVCLKRVDALTLVIGSGQPTPGVLTFDADASPFREHILSHGPEGDGRINAGQLADALEAFSR